MLLIECLILHRQFSVLFDILLAGFEFVKDAQIFPLLECLARIALPHGRMCTYKPQNLSECSIRLVTMTIPTDPVSRHQWNEDFERKLAAIYPKHGRVVSAVTPSFLRIARLVIESGTVARESAIRMRELCILQTDLPVEGIYYLGGVDLEGNWKEFTQSEKERIAREAVYLACDVDGFEDFRTF